jgi:hypothetical protein
MVTSVYCIQDGATWHGTALHHTAKKGCVKSEVPDKSVTIDE